MIYALRRSARQMGFIGWESWWKICYSEYYELCDEIDCKKCPAKLAAWGLARKGKLAAPVVIEVTIPLEKPAEPAPAPAPGSVMPVIETPAPKMEKAEKIELPPELVDKVKDYIKGLKH